MTSTKQTDWLSHQKHCNMMKICQITRQFGFIKNSIVKLNFLLAVVYTRPEIAVTVNQCTRFSVNLKITHMMEAVHHIIKYLLGTREKGLIFKPDLLKSFGIYSDTNFCGICNRGRDSHG
jgi:hypothetical protein